MTLNPLITFALVAYNQEEFIRDAVTGALAQTYQPLEIILSDDGSSDRTFSIMEEMAAAYTGPNKIILNRNVRNLGTGAHINRIMELSSGELIVIAAGDDISFPERTKTIVKLWEGSGRPKCSIYSAYRAIDEHGTVICPDEQVPLPAYVNHIDRMMEEACPGVVGATHAWHRDLFAKFGPLPGDLMVEDRAISARALLCDGIYYIKEPLACYRKVLGTVRAARVREKEYFNWLNQAVMKSITAACRTAGWNDRRVKSVKTRYLCNAEARWKAGAEKGKYIPFVLVSMLTGRMRFSSGLWLLPPFMKRICRFLLKKCSRQSVSG